MLLVSKDPVAIDATALRLLDEQRAVSRMPKASRDGGHVAEAAAKGLGNNDEKMILMKRVGLGSRGGIFSGAAVVPETTSSPPRSTRP